MNHLDIRIDDETLDGSAHVYWRHVRQRRRNGDIEVTKDPKWTRPRS